MTADPDPGAGSSATATNAVEASDAVGAPDGVGAPDAVGAPDGVGAPDAVGVTTSVLNAATDATPGGADLRCPQCQAGVLPSDQFCEACGAELSPVEPPAALSAEETPTVGMPLADDGLPATSTTCAACGGTFADDGYCGTCGARAVKPRDHFREQPADWVAAVCDRGVRHTRNEDAVALSADPAPARRAVLVVCDGVSNTTDSDIASLAAARAARDLLAHSRARGMATGSALVGAIGARLRAAADAASEAVIATAAPRTGDPPSCTFVAAVIEDDVLVVGSVGDSRAYWLADDGEARVLTTDDSLAAEQIAHGMSREEAESGPQAHAILRWLGTDAPDHTPRVTSMSLSAPGWVLLCSDGLWNYCSEADTLRILVRRLSNDLGGGSSAPGGVGREPMALAVALTDWANAQGGQDNITVALARITTPDS